MTTHDDTRVLKLSEEEFDLWERNLLTIKKGSGKVRTSLSTSDEDEKVRPQFRSEKTLRRESHLELLMLSTVDFVMEQLEELTEGACTATPAYVEIRQLSKSLARGKRPDGSKY